MATRHFHIPAALSANHLKYFGEQGRAWITALPHLAATCLERWELRPDGPHAYGGISVVIPVLRIDGTQAALKLQPVTDQTVDEPVALRAWGGDGAVQLLDHDPDSGSLLLERLNADRPLSSVSNDLAALTMLSGLLARLSAVPAPDGLRRLADIAAEMLTHVPDAVLLLADEAERALLVSCASAVRELLGETGNQLLHWDMHYDNVLAPLRPAHGSPGWQSIPNRWPVIPALNCFPRCGTGGTTSLPPATCLARYAADSTS